MPRNTRLRARRSPKPPERLEAISYRSYYMSASALPYETQVSGQSQTDSHSWNWPLRLLLVFLVLATTAKFAAFIMLSRLAPDPER